ncbi:hypothetical protein [Pseudobacillus badius]|uniref:hypothetical protein n=1 Tax=Bacillus badius TaxID=1455 RepID=UPI0024A0018A|nr:hypothetical protein [Bacillus badius]GLY11418.1 hypothetical protein Bbad01_26340 [Bacillus badius]
MKNIIWPVVIVAVLAVFWIIGDQTESDTVEPEEEQAKPTIMNDEKAQKKIIAQKEKNQRLAEEFKVVATEDYEGTTTHNYLEDFVVDSKKGIVSIYVNDMPKDKLNKAMLLTVNIWASHFENEFKLKEVKVYLNDEYVYVTPDVRLEQ